MGVFFSKNPEDYLSQDMIIQFTKSLVEDVITKVEDVITKIEEPVSNHPDSLDVELGGDKGKNLKNIKLSQTEKKLITDKATAIGHQMLSKPLSVFPSRVFLMNRLNVLSMQPLVI